MVSTSKSKSKSRSREVEDVVMVVDDDDKAEDDAEAEGEGGDDEDEEENEEEGEYEVAAILDHKQANGKYQYLVAWKGYGPEHNTWEPEEHVSHAEQVVNTYWADKPKTAPQVKKRGRGGPANVKPEKKPKAAKSNGSKRKSTAYEEEDLADFEDTHVDSMDKYERLDTWEDKVQQIDTIERSSSGGLLVYMTMEGGERVAQSTEVAYKRCPQKILKFYESHLKWKLAD